MTNYAEPHDMTAFYGKRSACGGRNQTRSFGFRCYTSRAYVRDTTADTQIRGRTGTALRRLIREARGSSGCTN